MQRGISKEIQLQVEGANLEGLAEDQSVVAMTLTEEMLSNWVREAGVDTHMEEVFRALWDDWSQRICGLSPAERLAALRLEVVDRRVRTLERATWALGCAVIDGAVAPDQAQACGEELMDRVAPIARDLATLEEESNVGPLRGDLQAASLEVLFAIDGQVMSPRLNRYGRARGG